MHKTVLLILMLVTACGNGSSSSAQQAQSTSSITVINGIPVPPEPKASVNNSTLLGLDNNNNGIRDDVDRQIATTYGTNANHYNAAMRTARANQEYLMSNGDPVKSTSATSNAVITGACISKLYGGDNINGIKSIRFVWAITINTPERLSAYRASSSASTEITTQIPAEPCL